MEKVLSSLKMVGFFLVTIIIISLITSLLNFITPISKNILNIVTTISMIIIFFIFGIKYGKRSNSKGWLCGIKNGLIMVLLLLLISLIFFNQSIHPATFIYYVILILTNVFGSIIGINKKKDA